MPSLLQSILRELSGKVILLIEKCVFSLSPSRITNLLRSHSSCELTGGEVLEWKRDLHMVSIDLEKDRLSPEGSHM